MEKGEDLFWEGGVEGVDVVVCGGVVEDDFFIFVIYVDVYFFWMNWEIFLGVVFGECLVFGVCDV